MESSAAMDIHTNLAEVKTKTVEVTDIKKKKGFIGYIHSFRGIAIIFVAAGHLLLKWPDNSPIHIFMRVFWENGSVLFVFIAGYLFQYLSKKFEYRDFLRKKIQNVIIPYFIVSIPIIAYRLMTNDNPGYIYKAHADFDAWGSGKKIFYFISHGAHLQQLWFVPMIAIYYVIAPLLIKLDRNPKMYYILLALIPVSLMVGREPFSDILKMFVHFASVYIFGMFMSRYKDRFVTFSDKYWPGITLLTFVLLAVDLYYYPAYNDPLNYLFKMVLCCFFLYWLRRLDSKMPKMLSVMADVSFGIFFLHYYFLLVIKALYEHFFHRPIPGNLVYWTVDLLLILFFTVVTIKTVKKVIPKYSRYLIGY